MEMADVTSKDLGSIRVDLDQPTPLYSSGNHRIYWLGITDETAFRCNTYFILDGKDAILVDPGSRAFFNQVQSRIRQIIDPASITAMILCHQDPDVGASLIDWLNFNPEIKVFTTPRTHVLLPHYGKSDYSYFNVSANPEYPLSSGGSLRFIEAPFLHFPGAFVTYDSLSQYVFSGDIWAALDLDWTLTVKSFPEHVSRMNLFHLDYMASNLAARGFARKLDGIPMEAILPQHGSIIGPEHVNDALDYLRNLKCGTDIIYADLQP